MRELAIVLGALVVSLTTATAVVVAHAKSAAAPATNAARAVAPAAASPAFAKASSRKTQGQKASGKKTAVSKVAAKHGSKGAQAKKGPSRKADANPRSRGGDSFRARPVLQFHGGAAGLFAGWPFTRPGSPGRVGTNAGKHRSGGFVAWFGPVFWPYAYDDMFAYILWPFDAFDYGEAFWAFAYDDLFEGIFWADAEVEGERADVVAAADADAPSSEDRSRAGALGLEGQSREFAQICGERTPGLSQWPILRIAQSVGLTREQRSALKNLEAAAAAAARRLKSACPAATATTPIGRLDAMQERLEAMLQATILVRPALEKFYESLSDPQKARFNAEPPAVAGDEAVIAASGENELVPQICTDHPGGLSVQTVDRIEHVVRPIAAQYEALNELRTAAARAAAILRAACPVGTPRNPRERLAAMQQRLGAMIDAAGMLHPALQNFYGSLTDGQKTRFDAVGKQADAN